MSRTDGITTPASPARERNAAPRLIAVTQDATLGHALQELANDISIVIVEDVRALTDEMLRHGSNLALLDAAAVETPLDGVVDALMAQFPDLRLMVAGQAREQGLLASRIANEHVFRFVHKPASAQRLKVFLDAATRDAGRRRDAAAAVNGAAPRPPSKLAFTIAGLVALCVAVAAAWLFWPHGAAARLNARDLGKVEVMLQQAGAAMNVKRFVSFDGTSAAELYRDVLQLDDANEQAQAGLVNALSGAVDSARQALTDGKLDEAANGMEAVRQVDPKHRGLKELVAQIDAETKRRLSDTKQREAMQERQAQIRTAVEKVEASIRSGALLDPENDNATTQFQAAQNLSAGDPAVRAARGDVTAALVTAGDKAVTAKRLSDARRYAAAAGRINNSAPGLAGLQLRIDEAAAPPPVANKAPVVRPEPVNIAPTPAPVVTPPVSAAPTPLPTSAAPPVVEPVSATPEPPAAAPAAAKPEWVPGEGVVAAGKLKALRVVQAEFPTEAQATQTTGWVELEFTVAKDGSVKAAKVTASEPKRTFDNAALDALRQYRFAPVLKDGQPVEQRAALRIRFKF